MRRAHQRHAAGDRQQRGRPVRTSAAIAVALVAAAVGAPSAPAAAGFERGDVLASVGSPSVIAHFAADGTAKGALADTAGAGQLCFDPSGEHLVAPGAGLYDNAGSLLASDWASVELPGACTVDAAGNVFMARGPYSGDTLATRRATFRRFDLTGHLLQSYDVDGSGFTYGREVYTVDIAPDQCTIYYGLGGGSDVKRYDVCTGTQLAPFGSGGFPCDELRVRPNGQVVMTCDSHGALLDASGILVHGFDNPTDSPSLRYAALDADGSSFWMGAGPGLVTRFDIATGQQFESWSAGPGGLRGLAVYSPPLPAQENPPQHNTATSLDPGAIPSAAHSPEPSAPARTLAIAAPALIIAHGRLITAASSPLVDTGMLATCPAGGPRCRATVALTMATTGARAAAARTMRIGTLNTTVAAGAKARLVVRLNKKGAALVRKRGAVTVVARATIRAGSGRAVVAKTSVRVRLRRAR
jgi:hypothetical protein